MTSSLFFLSTLNYDARSTTHQIYNLPLRKERSRQTAPPLTYWSAHQIHNLNVPDNWGYSLEYSSTWHCIRLLYSSLQTCTKGLLHTEGMNKGVYKKKLKKSAGSIRIILFVLFGRTRRYEQRVEVRNRSLIRAQPSTFISYLLAFPRSLSLCNSPQRTRAP